MSKLIPAIGELFRVRMYLSQNSRRHHGDGIAAVSGSASGNIAMKSRKNTVKPIGLKDITIVDDAKMRKAITAAALGNAMEWFDFGVYGFVAYVLGKVFFPGADPGVQMIAALATFSVPFLIRPLGGLFFGALGDKYGRQKVLAATIVIMSLSTFAIGLIPSYASIGIWAPAVLAQIHADTK
jgi:MFS transporter, MHS family, proline/betaine transporter